MKQTQRRELEQVGVQTSLLLSGASGVERPAQQVRYCKRVMLVCLNGILAAMLMAMRRKMTERRIGIETERDEE